MRSKQLSISLLLSIFLLSPGSCLAADSAGNQGLTQEASALFQKGNLEQAVELQEKAVNEKPQDWLSHAALSFYSWHQGDVIKAIEQGQRALDLAPENYVASTNLALIKEGLDDNTGAISLYEIARKAAPESWVPWLGLVRCQTKNGHEEIALSLLEEMSLSKNNNFDWYFELADICLRMDKPALAAKPAERALALARKLDEKAASVQQLLMVYLRNNQLDEAGTLKDRVFKECQPKNSELYVRTASALLPASDPAAGKDFLNCALRNLSAEDDCEGFFRLGRVFEQKSAEQKVDAGKSALWLSNAEQAYRRAITLAKTGVRQQSQYYMGLAAVLDQQDKLDELKEVLSTVRKLDSFETLAPYLISEIDKSRGAASKTEDGTNGNYEPNAAIKHCPVHLDNVQFKITGLNCGCQVSKVLEALESCNGVAYVYLAANIKPFVGTLLIDPAKISLRDAFAQTTEKVRVIYATMKTPIVPGFETVSISSVSSAGDAIRLAHAAKHGSTTNFYNAFKSVQPFEPVRELALRSNKAML